MKNKMNLVKSLALFLLVFVVASSVSASEVYGNLSSSGTQTLSSSNTNGSVSGIVSSLALGSQVAGTFGNGTVGGSGGTIGGTVTTGATAGGGGGGGFTSGGFRGGSTTLASTSNTNGFVGGGGSIGTTGATTSRPVSVFANQVGGDQTTTSNATETLPSTQVLTPEVLSAQASTGNDLQNQLAQVAGASVTTETGMSIWLWVLLILLLVLLAYTLYRGLSNENKIKPNRF